MATKILQNRLKKISKLSDDLHSAIMDTRIDREAELEEEYEIDGFLSEMEDMMGEFDNLIIPAMEEAKPAPKAKKKKSVRHTEPCPDCGEMKLNLVSDQDTDWYGNLKHYKCTYCKETFVSEDGGELATAAVSY